VAEKKRHIQRIEEQYQQVKMLKRQEQEELGEVVADNDDEQPQ